MMPWLRVCILIACISTLACPVWVPNAAAAFDDDLRAKYEGKTLMLRNFYCGEELRFDVAGNLASGGEPGAWTLCRNIKIHHVHIKDGRLKLAGQRVYLFYDSQLKQFRDVTEIEPDQNKKSESFKKMIESQRVSIEIELPVPADDVTVSSVVDKLFYASQEEFSKAVPSFWKELIGPARESSNDGRGRGSTYDVGVKTHTGKDVVALDEEPASLEPGRPLHVGNGVSAPRPIWQPDPDYSDAARQAKYQGTVVMNMIVGADGRVHRVVLRRCLGMGLDERAVEKVRTWSFSPATKDGKPVAVEVNVEVTFNLY